MPDLSIETVTVKNEEGKKETILYHVGNRRERFAQLMAVGDKTQVQCYAEAYEKALVTDADYANASQCASRLAHDTQVVLRIQELKKPIIRKIRRKLEYSLQKALETCQTAEHLALEAGDAKTLLKAVEMQATLAKLISQDINVNHRYGVLDDSSTEVLLEMKREIEVRQAKRKKLLGTVVTNVETVPGEGA